MAILGIWDLNRQTKAALQQPRFWNLLARAEPARERKAGLLSEEPKAKQIWLFLKLLEGGL